MTIYDIAREAGVSASTISRVINRKPGVNPVTRQRVLDILERHRFSSNTIVRGVDRLPTRTVGVLINDIRSVHHANSAYYIEEELKAQGYHVDIINAGATADSRLKAIEVLKERRAEGAILIGSTFQDPEMEAIIRDHLESLPVIMVNGFIDLPNVVGILSDDQQGVEKCVYFLAERGHTRLAFVRNGTTPSALLKEKGFLNGMTLLYPGKAYYWSYDTEDSLQNGYDVTRRILEEHPNVEGIIYAVDILAAGGLRALRDMNITVPEKVGVIGVDNSIYCDICYPKLTSLDNRTAQASVMAAHVLTDNLEGRRQATNKIMLLSSIVERETT